MTSRPRLSLLAELGRIESKDLIEWADVICQDKLPTSEAIRRVSAWRHGRDVFPAADQAELTQHLAKALKGYWAIHGKPDDAAMLDMTRAAVADLEGILDEIAKGETD